MADITVRNISDETLISLRVRAAQNGRSIDDEILKILDDAVGLMEQLKIGSELAAFGDKFELDSEIKRDREPIRMVTFE